MENDSGSVFNSNEQEEVTNSYKFKNLFKRRLWYYITCGVLVLACGSMLLADYLITNKVEPTYEMFKEFKIDKAEDQLNMKENEYFIYYYFETCAACSKIKDVVFAYLSEQKISNDIPKLYLLDIESVDIPSENPPSSYVDIDDYKDIVVGGTPFLLKIKDKKVEYSRSGGEEVAKELKL